MKFPPWRLLSASVLVSFAGNFPMGYHTCVVNSAQGVFRRFLNESYDHQFGYSLSNEMYSVLWAGCLSLYDLGAVLGVMFVPLLCDRMGRKWGIVWWSSLPCFLGSLMFYLSHRLWSLELFMAGRFVMGMNGGFMSGAQGIFLTEASPGEFRGFVSSFQELSDCITSLAGMIFGLHQVLGNDANLDALLAIPLIPAGLLMVALLVFPDTPKYLLLTRKDESAAEKSIRFYHGADVDMELAKEEMLAENPESSTTSIRSLWTDTITRKAMLVGIAANFAAVFTGIGAYWNFSTQLFTNVGANFQLSQYATVVMTAVNTAGTLVSMNFVDRLGRRPLLLSSLLGCSLCNVAFLLADQLKLNNVIMGDWLSYVSLSAALLFNLFYSVGAGPVPWFIGKNLISFNFNLQI